MNIVVCIKAVPHVIGSVRLQTNSKDIVRSDFSYKINDTDDNALEEALLLRERFGGKVTVITLSCSEEQENSRQIFCECFAKGADESVKLTDELFREIDSYVTARLLAEAIRTMPFDLVLTGSQALDDNLGNVGPMIAVCLGIPYATLAVKIEAERERLVVRTELDEGFQQIVELDRPALISVQSGINEPRYASLSRIRMSQSRPVRVLTAKDLNVCAESINNWKKVTTNILSMAEKKQTEYICGTPNEVACKLLEIVDRIKSGTLTP